MADNKVIIIGGGPGGYVAAIRAAQLGLNPLLIEKDKNLGGTCLNRGCIPTKALLESAGRMEAINSAADFGITNLGQASVDMAAVQTRKRGIVRRMAMGIDGLLKKNGVQVVHGQAQLVEPGKVMVGSDCYEAENVILATGSVCSVPKVFPVDQQHVLTSDAMLELEHIPQSLIVVGSGAVGMEFASLYAAFGSKVTVVEALPRVLPLEDEDVSQEVQRLFRKKGIQVYTGCCIENVEVTGEGVSVSGAGLPEQLNADILLAAAGRRANIAGLWAEQLAISTERGRIVVDEYMRTSIDGVYAIGDLVPTPQLAHMASAEGILAVEHIAGLRPNPLNAAICPSATYCHPQVASVGLTEAQAREQNLPVAVGKFPFAALGKAAVAGNTDGFVKVVADSANGRLLGVHMVGAHVTDLISEAVVALQCQARLADLVASVHPHPTLSESLAEACHAALGSPLNFMPPPARRR